MKWRKASEYPDADGIYICRGIQTKAVTAVQFRSGPGWWDTSYPENTFEWLDETPQPLVEEDELIWEEVQDITRYEFDKKDLRKLKSKFIINRKQNDTK